MPKAKAGGIAAAVSKLALDVGAELSKDEDVRKMGKKVMDQLRSPSASAPASASSKKKGKETGSSSSSSKSGSHSRSKSTSGGGRTSKILSNIGSGGSGSRRPSMPHRSSHDSGSGRSSPTGQHHRSSRSASYSQPPYPGMGYSPSPQFLQPGVPAEYAQLKADDSADLSRGSGRNGGYASKSAGTSPTSSPRPFATAYLPAQHRAVIEARALDGYGSEGYTAGSPNSNGNGNGYSGRSRLSRTQGESDEAFAGRERANSAGALHLPSSARGGYFSEGGGGRIARAIPTSASGGSPMPSAGDSSLFIQHAESHRLPAPPSTPPPTDNNTSPDYGRFEGSIPPPHTHKSSPLSNPGLGNPVLVHSSNGTNVVLPPHGTTGSHAMAHSHSHGSSPSSSHHHHNQHHHHSSSSAHTSPTALTRDALEGLSKKEGKKPAHQAPLTHSQTYDALASARSRIGAGVPLADVTFAARCATLIYTLFDLEDTRDWIDSGQDKLEKNPTLLDVTFSDPGQGIKNWALFKRKSDGCLIISVRGTSRGPDWVDDMLCHLKEKDFAMEKDSKLRCKDGSIFDAHSSFLRCALAMVPDIRKVLLTRTKSQSGASSPAVPSLPTSPLSTSGSDSASVRSSKRGANGAGKPLNKLIITGHSAGGAVASLLYLLLEHHYSSLLSQFSQMFCITFGSAACVRRTRPLTSRPSDQALAFILRGDPVPRLDMNYGLYLLDHYARLPSKPGVGAVAPSPATGGNGQSLDLLAENEDDEAAGPSILRTGPGHAIPKQTAARDLDGETFLSRLTELYGSERESERRASNDGTLEVPLQVLFPAGEMLMIDVGRGDVWEIDAQKLEATSPVDVERHEMKMYMKTLAGIEKAQPKLIID
ncbi:hypothetical protein CF326_g7905 [Tilletia indica]|nr:hypothetical protein CF326_g7905 [Tilletia indica]